ncbi:M14 family metallopeptidase [Lacisediminimonas profundi]|uniref:M14 family metallopeptidase n=1 Tax=Lacisediminimonas profundi TaxID=2603856 RepID=UPI003BA8EEAE
MPAVMSAAMSPLIPDYWDCFALDYSGAREKFRLAAQAAGARLCAYQHPEQLAPDGSALSIDVAHLGNPAAAKQLLIVSGTHGLEGAAGSAAQIAWMKSGGAQALPADLGVLLVHSLNPYGHQHGSRTTENNVDLNRNFVNHNAAYPQNQAYASLHEKIIPDHWTEARIQQADEAARLYGEQFGADALYNALASGQYSHPDGLVYGGSQREWSNRTLETIVQVHLEHARQVGFIDWHTGIGDYAEPFFLCFNEDGGKLQARAASWWGADRVLGQRPNGMARPNYQGLVFFGLQEFLGDRPVVGAVIEFGTRGLGTRYSLRLDQWLRHKSHLHPDPMRDAHLRSDLLDAFVPVSNSWRRSVLRHSMEITQQAIAGVSAW